MSGARGTKDRAIPKGNADSHEEQLEQIEYLLYQSTQGIHFMFDNSDIAQAMSRGHDEKAFFTNENMEKVQGLLSRFLECPSMQEKKLFLERLPSEEYELLIRAYFQLVEKTILAHSNIRH